MTSSTKTSGRVTSCRSRFTTRQMVSVQISLAQGLFQPCFLPGSDLRGSASSITRSITEQIFSLPLHWTKSIDFPGTATHVTSFCPSGANVVGPIVSRIPSGRGVRVIIPGDKFMGDELYDSTNVKYEDWRSKKWAPRLIKIRYASTLCGPGPAF